MGLPLRSACYPALVGYLAQQILGNAAFTMLVKVARNRKFDYLLFGAVNYLMAALVSLVVTARAGGTATPLVIVLGAANGTQYQLTFLLMYALLSMTGIAVMSSFLRLAVFIPVLASIAIWGELPSPLQALGLALTALALPLLGTAARRTAPPDWRSWRALALIVTTLLLTGAGLLAAKAFAELHQEAQRPVYLSAAFTTAALFSLLSLAVRRRRSSANRTGTLRYAPPRQGVSSVARGKAAIGARSLHAHSPAQPALEQRRADALPALALGVLAGLCNVGQLAAFLRGLASIPGIVAFPVTSAGGLLVVSIAGRLAWNERLAGRAGAGLALAAVALVNAG